MKYIVSLLSFPLFLAVEIVDLAQLLIQPGKEFTMAFLDFSA